MANAVNRILWWSLVATLPLYVAVAFLAPLPGSPDASADVLLAVLAVVSVGMGIGTLVYRRRMLSGPIQRGELDPTTPKGQQKALPHFILNLVLSESVGIYGLVLAFLSGRSVYAVPFAVGALALMCLHRPTAPDLVPPLGGYAPGGRPPPIA